MTKTNDIVRRLEEMATLLELKGANPFKVRAYQNAARSLMTHDDDLELALEKGQLTKIKGVGPGIAKDIQDFFHTGEMLELKTLRESFPSTLFELLEVPGLGPKKVKKLFDELQIESLGELEYACHENRLVKLDGFGSKTQEKILKGIALLKQRRNTFLYPEAFEQAHVLLQQMSKWKEIKQIEIAGSLRRRKETIHDIDLVCSADQENAEVVMRRFVNLVSPNDVISHGTTKSSISYRGIQVDLRVVKESEYIFALHHFTGSKEHNTLLRGLAKKQGYILNEYGLFKGESLVKCQTEANIYEQLKLDYIPPELREGLSEIEMSKDHQLPNIITLEDIRGIFHVHTNYSDGKNTLEEMVRAASERGYTYIGISDHSQSAFYAHGLKEKDIDAQFIEIDRVQKQFPKIRIFKGIESDILSDGNLDYPKHVLKRFDFVIGSVHSRFKMSQEEMTKRCVRALENPFCTILGHPTGRLLLARDGFQIDVQRILDVAKKEGKIVELNANPHRLDLDWRILYTNRNDCPYISINPDAHDVEGLSHVTMGVSMARKGGLTKDHVFNTKTTKEIETYFARQRA
ncbi:MAG: DNA polymerase/3'-5' exonuclease PolX [Bdellovibrionales bacterium]|nr:DNA polymerase/3'-5' exonuclease PolX [Bdellovibrionales bacterium]